MPERSNGTECAFFSNHSRYIISSIKCPVLLLDVNTTRLHFSTATLFLFALNHKTESGLMRCAGPPQQLMHFHAALTCVRTLYKRRGCGRRGANGARWPATRKTTASCCAATISLGLVIVAASLARGSNSPGLLFSQFV